METDREVLAWFHARLEHQHKESHLLDYMHRLRWIILATPKGKISRGQRIKKACNSPQALLALLPKPTNFERTLLSE